MLDVVVGQFAEHIASETIDNGFACLASSAARIFRLYAHYRLQHSVRRVRLISASQTRQPHLKRVTPASNNPF